jgi:hypothetical protein
MKKKFVMLENEATRDKRAQWNGLSKCIEWDPTIKTEDENGSKTQRKVSKFFEGALK